MKEKTTDLTAARKVKENRRYSAHTALPEQAPAWTGELDAQVLKGEVKGEALYAALQGRARQLNHTLQDMCRHLDFSYPYFSQLRSGRRKLSSASEEFTYACAKYLGVPRLTVLALADIVSPHDLYSESDAITVHLHRAFDHICTDPTWAHLAPESVRISPPTTQYLIVRLYERACGLQLLPEAVEPERLAQSMITLRKLKTSLIKARATQDEP
ncbi:hypothetical protein H0A66_10415 [Alcaligenaceae bacterium]|nr:hypothetical protein [Alcaligenaceae bacterium]